MRRGAGRSVALADASLQSAMPADTGWGVGDAILAIDMPTGLSPTVGGADGIEPDVPACRPMRPDPPPLRVAGLDHVVLRRTRLDATIAFYG